MKKPAKKATKRATKKVGTKKATKLESLSQVHGKEEREFKPTTLDQIWGDAGQGAYGTMEEEKYKKTLREMNKSDLKSHAVKKGLVPIDDRLQLEKRLISEFRKHINSFKRPQDNLKKNKVSKSSKDILSEGK